MSTSTATGPWGAVDKTQTRASTAPPEAKVRVPTSRRPMVHRTRILRALRTAKQQVVLVVAPAGYGKTNLLAQWVRTTHRPAVWLTLEDSDNDPTRFLHLLAAALDRVVSVDPSISVTVADDAITPRDVVGRLLASIAAEPGPLFIVIDDAHLLTDRTCLDALAEFVNYLPPGAEVAIAGRQPSDLPFERWRLDGRLLEIGADQLAMDEREARELARHLGVDLTSDAAHRLTVHTAGWPALIALVTLAIRRTGDPDLVTSSDPGNLVSDYLRAELLEQRPKSVIEFMTRASILDPLDGPACDAILERHGSAALLDRLAKSTLLIDDYAGSFRFHPLLQSFLMHELESREPGETAVLHHRAAGWFDEIGDVDQAVEHAFASGDVDLAATLVTRNFTKYHWGGRWATLRAWFQRFSDADLAQRPWLTLMAAWDATIAGDLEASERLGDLAEQGTYAGPPPDGTASLDSGRAMLRVAQSRHGAAAMLADASYAVELEGPGSPYHEFALWLLHLAHRVNGDRPAREAALDRARLAIRSGQREGMAVFILGYCASNAMDRDDWDAAADYLDQCAALGARRFDWYPSSAVGRVAVARLLLHRGEVQALKLELARASGLRPALTAAAPVVAVEGLLGFARLHLSIGDPGGARALMLQASDILRLRPGLGVLPAEVEELRTTLAALPIGLSGASTLTTAELRVLHLLPYYLSFKEIAQRLNVKVTTIKTHALAIYGKLGVSSRGEAIELAVEAGLLERFSVSGQVSPSSEDAPHTNS
jgi:LuxR family maltose regulon positive regulatory protein